MIKKFDGEYPERFLKEIFDYLSLNKRDYKKAIKFEQPKFDKNIIDLCDSFRSPHIWFNEKGKWF